MFALPEAKRIRREDLGRSDDSDWSDDGEMDAELQARLNAQIAKSLGLDHDEGGSYTMPDRATESQSRDQDQSMKSEPAESGDEGGYSFRLFSTAGPTPKIVLEDPEGDPGEGAIVKSRSLSYYLAGKPCAELQSQYEFAAVTGDEVISRSRTRSWGLELPWKVTAIKVVVKKAKTGEVSLQGDDDGMDASATKRKRPGKKRRIAMRTKERAKAKAQEAAKQKELDKEEHSKEKKKRMNRLKKLRKKAKKKEGKEGDGKDDDSGDD